MKKCTCIIPVRTETGTKCLTCGGKVPPLPKSGKV